MTVGKENIVQYQVIGLDFVGNEDYDNIDILNADEIVSVTSVVDKNGEPWLIVSYIDPEFCITTSLVCKELKKLNNI